MGISDLNLKKGNRFKTEITSSRQWVMGVEVGGGGGGKGRLLVFFFFPFKYVLIKGQLV